MAAMLSTSPNYDNLRAIAEQLDKQAVFDHLSAD